MLRIEREEIEKYKFNKNWYDPNNKELVWRCERFFEMVSDNAQFILDADQPSVFTDMARKKLDQAIYTASGDFNRELKTPKKKFDLILSSHVIEHLFNPHLYLENLKNLLSDSGVLHVAYPVRPKFLWTKHHFHEIDRERFEDMAEDAGLRIVGWQKRLLKKSWKFYFMGIRPFLRIFLDKEIHFVLVKTAHKKRVKS